MKTHQTPYPRRKILRIVALCHGLLIDCHQATRAQSEMLDGELPWARRAGLWMHVLICKWCRRYGEQIRFLHVSVSQHGEPLSAAGPCGLSKAARERIKRRLRDKMQG